MRKRYQTMMTWKDAVGISFVYITIYSVMVLSEWLRPAILLVSLAPIILIWMVFKILNAPHQSEHTFEDRFYEDYDYERS